MLTVRQCSGCVQNHSINHLCCEQVSLSQYPAMRQEGRWSSFQNKSNKVLIFYHIQHQTFLSESTAVLLCVRGSTLTSRVMRFLLSKLTSCPALCFAMIIVQQHFQTAICHFHPRKLRSKKNVYIQATKANDKAVIIVLSC